MTTLRLTYEELAERLGRSPEGARMLARRQQRQGHWRIDRGNDGKARVVVEEETLVGQPTGRPPGYSLKIRPPDHPSDHPTDQAEGELGAELRARVQALEVEREALLEAGAATAKRVDGCGLAAGLGLLVAAFVFQAMDTALPAFLPLLGKLTMLLVPVWV